MSQASYIVAAGSGAAVRAAINAALAAQASGHSGTTVPVYAVAGMLYWRTDIPGTGVWTLYAYDGASSVAIGTLNTSTHAFTLASAVLDNLLGSSQGMLAKRGASAWAGLALGSALQQLRVNAGGTDLEYAGSLAVISDQALSAASSVTFQSISTAYKNLALFYEILPGTNATDLLGRVYHSNVEETGANYNYLNAEINSSGGAGGAGVTGATSFKLSGNPMKSSSTLGGAMGVAFLCNYQSTRFTKILSLNSENDNTNNYYTFNPNVALVQVAGPIDGLKLFPSAGTFSGRTTLIGF